jgi:hypothetical protein
MVIFLAGKIRRISQNAHLRRYASSFVIATYEKIRLIPQDSRTLHLNIFEQSERIGIN